MTHLGAALKYVKYHGIDTVLITSFGEPTLSPALRLVIRAVGQESIPIIELQTNGLRLCECQEELLDYSMDGLHTLAISICSPDAARSAEIMKLGEYRYWDLIDVAVRFGLMVRISLNLIKGEISGYDEKWLRKLKEHGVSQLTFRELGLPDRIEDTPKAEKKKKWIEEHALPEEDVFALELAIRDNGTFQRKLFYGPEVYDVEGLSVVLATCMSHGTDEEEIRSLILQPDGRVYHNWDYEGSILF